MEQPHAAKAFQLHLDGGIGLSTAGVTLGGVALVRLRPLAIGAAADTSGIFSSRTSGGFLIGASFHGVQRVALDVLGELGAASHYASGGLLNDDPGATATIGYAGARVGLRWYVGAPAWRMRPTLGMWFIARADLDRSTKSYSYQESGWFSGSVREETSQKTLGGGGELGVRLALGFDLTP